MNFSGSLQVAARGSARPVSDRKIGSANGNRTRRLAVQASPDGSKWLCFQSGWYSGMLRNTATDRRRHSAVTAQPWAEEQGWRFAGSRPTKSV
jgi:hypothetical protein